VRKLWSIFHWKRKKYQDKLSKKQWQDLIDFEGNEWFAVLTASRPELRVGFRISYATLGAFMKYKRELPKKQPKYIKIKNTVSLSNGQKFFEEAAKIWA
jgi:dGTPase